MEITHLIGRNVRIRSHKVYPNARNHVIVGCVQGETMAYLLVYGCSFHFGTLVNGMNAKVQRSPESLRAIPWSAIEVVTEVSDLVDWNKACGFDEQGHLILLDEPKTVLAIGNDR